MPLLPTPRRVDTLEITATAGRHQADLCVRSHGPLLQRCSGRACLSRLMRRMCRSFTGTTSCRSRTRPLFHRQRSPVVPLVALLISLSSPESGIYIASDYDCKDTKGDCQRYLCNDRSVIAHSRLMVSRTGFSKGERIH